MAKIKIFDLIKKAQVGAEYNLNLENILMLKQKASEAPPQTPGQMQLFEGPEPGEISTFQRIGKKKFEILENYFVGMIDAAGEAVKAYEVSNPTNDEIDESEIYDDAQYRIEGSNYESPRTYIKHIFRDETPSQEFSTEIWEFIENFTDETLYSYELFMDEKEANKQNAIAYLSYIFKSFLRIYRAYGMKHKQYDYGPLKELYKETLDKINERNAVYEDLVSRAGGEAVDFDDIVRIDWNGLFYKMHKLFVDAIFENGERLVSSRGMAGGNKKFYDFLGTKLPGIKHTILDALENAINDDDLIEKYVEENRDHIVEGILEGRYESNQENVREAERTLTGSIDVHIPMGEGLHPMPKYYGPIEFLAKIGKEGPFLGEEINEESMIYNWKRVSLGDFSHIAEELQYAPLEGAFEAATIINGHILAIKDMVKSDPGLNMIFGSVASNVSITEGYGFMEGKAKSYLENNKEMLQIYAQGENAANYIEDLERMNAQERERAKLEQEKKEKERYERWFNSLPEAERKKIEDEKMKEEFMKQERAKFEGNFGKFEKMTPEELEKAKEYGYAKKPFEFGYEASGPVFPGQGAFSDFMNKKNMVSFKISIFPKKHKKIPDEVFSGMQMHVFPDHFSEEYAPAVGWVGGFYDTSKKYLYVAEVQSDIAQNTRLMKDPEKSKEQKMKEFKEVLAPRIAELEKRIAQPVSNQFEAKIKGLEDKIKRTDPNSPAYSNMLQALEKMKEQAPNASAQGPDPRLVQELEKYKNEARRILNEINEDEKYTENLGWQSRFYKPQFHEYKSAVENYLQDWIGLFFNTVMRYAKKVEAEKVFIITPEDLVKRWKTYIPEPEQTLVLFKRIYENWANFYKATQQGTWFVIDMAQEGIRIAKMNWYNRAKFSNFSKYNCIIKTAKFNVAQWKEHLATYLRTYLTHYKQTEYHTQQVGREETESILKEALQTWLKTEVPDALKTPEGYIDPDFLDQVDLFVQQNFGIDAVSEIYTSTYGGNIEDAMDGLEDDAAEMGAEEYEVEFDETNPNFTITHPQQQENVPSVDELEGWWNTEPEPETPSVQELENWPVLREKPKR